MAEYLPSPQSGEVNILPLFTEIEKNNCFISIYSTQWSQQHFQKETIKNRFRILFLYGLRIIHSVGGE